MIATTEIAKLLIEMRQHAKFTKHDSVSELARKRALVRYMVAVADRISYIDGLTAQKMADGLTRNIQNEINKRIKA